MSSSTSSLSLASVNSTSTVPSTQCSPIPKSMTFVEDTSSQLLQYLEPHPVLSPSYNDLPPGGCPKFPVYDSHDVADSLPLYSPAVYKVGCVCRKVEWLSPYELANSRSWKTVVIEINSTQLNFYSIPSNLELYLLHFECMKRSPMVSDFVDYNSSVTTDQDYQFYKCIRNLSIFKNPIRSYSLQHCKIGLAVDYKKRTNVLRVRAETEQMLLHFNNANDLINWNLAINIGKDLSLDINDRELPKYRTVPRRRRNRLYDTIMTSQNVTDYYSDMRRDRSYSDPVSLTSKLSKLKLRFKRNSVPNLTNLVIKRVNEVEIETFDDSSVVSSSVNSAAASITDVVPAERPSIDSATVINDRLRDDDEDVDDINDLHSDDEDEDSPVLNRTRKLFHEDSFVKWNPPAKQQSEKRYFKNCLRCIKPLNCDDSWISKDLVQVQKDETGHVWIREFVVGSHGLIPKIK